MNPCPKSRVILVVCAIAFALPLAAAAQKPAANAAPLRADAWPREVQMANATAIVYQPQISQWVGNRIDFRSAVAIRTAGKTDEAFGVVFASARTKVDKSARTVVIDRLEITKSDFPTLPDHGAAYSAELQKRFASAVRIVALDQLKASPALAATVAPPVAVQNTPPTVIVSYAPAILVPIDGTPALRPVPGSTQFLRVINTRALILQRAVEKDYFIHVFDGWLYSASLDGPWAPPFITPDGIDAVAKAVAATHVVDMLDGGPGAKTTPSLAKGVPAIYTSQVPTELIVFNGQPQMIEVQFASTRCCGRATQRATCCPPRSTAIITRCLRAAGSAPRRSRGRGRSSPPMRCRRISRRSRRFARRHRAADRGRHAASAPGAQRKFDRANCNRSQGQRARCLPPSSMARPNSRPLPERR